jgi:hypothetical protein|tara:strand:+ start:903 stop:1091 length:189 start_codon:yes stop_codon:yes gene_type:complete
MPKFEVNITRTITDRFIVTADDLDEAEGIAEYLAEGRDGDIKPDYTKFGEEIIDVEAVDESP